jgi:replicative DNA helicase
MKKALDIGENPDNGAYDYGAMIEARTEERIDRAAGKLPPTGITTGFADIDRVLYHKGWGRRELSVIMGAAKAGKTTALLEFGISACGNINRYNVLYVTLEVSAKIISERLDARISTHFMNELGKNIHDVDDKVKKFMANAGKFVVHEFPTGSMRASDLRRLLERYKAKGQVFDLVIVDYADLMSPERVTDNSIENSKNVYTALRGLAMMENVAILTATQTNRDGAKKVVATMTDIAEDFNKVRIADIVISINKTEEESKLKQARLFFAAVRNGPSGFAIRIGQDLGRMKFISEVIGEE